MINQKEQDPNLESRTYSVVQWLGLTDVPEASDIDPSGKLGLQGAFRNEGNRYSRIIPSKVIEKQKESSKNEQTSTEIPLLEKTVIGGKTYPLFKEQVYAAARQLIELGLKIPEVNMVAGDGFAMGSRSNEPTIKTSGKIVTTHRTHRTKDPNVSVSVERNGKSDNVAEKVSLTFHT